MYAGDPNGYDYIADRNFAHPDFVWWVTTDGVVGGNYPDSSNRTVPKILASREMTDAGHQLWLHPLSIGDFQSRNWTAFESALL